MFTISKSMVGTAAVIAVGLVAAMDLAQSRTPEMSASATVSARFPASAEMMAVRSLIEPAGEKRQSAPKTKKAPAESCVHEHWPYMADECLSSKAGDKARPPVRTIAIERRIAEAAPQLIKLASR